MSLREHVRETVKLSAPLVGAQACIMSMAVVDNLVVGHLGPGPLAAMAMALTLYYFCFIVRIGIMTTVGPLISSEISAGRAETVGQTARRAWELGLVLALGMMVACSQGRLLLPLLGQNADLVPLADQFLRSALWGAPAATGYLALRQFTEGTGDTRPSVVVAAMAALANPFLDVGLVLGHFGLPRLEMPGAGVALATANWLSFLLLAAYIWRNPRYRAYRFWSKSPAGPTLLHMLTVGLPMGGSLLSEMSFFGVTTLLMGTLGTVELASHQIALNVCSLAFTLPLGVSMGAALRVGQAAGRQDHEGVRLAGRAAILLVLGSQCVSSLCFLTLADSIVGLYTDYHPVTALAATLLRLGAVFQIFDGMQVAGMGMLRGLLDTRIPFLAAVGSYWLIGIPLGAWLAFSRHHGPSGLWMGLIVGLAIAACLHQWRFHVLTTARPR